MSTELKLVSWNVNRRDVWESLTTGAEFQVALVQEAPRPASRVVHDVVPGWGDDWSTRGWSAELRTAVASLSPDIHLRPHKLRDAHLSEFDALGISRAGTLAVADVYREDIFLVTVVSAYSAWESPPGDRSPIFADASAHRLLSDLAPLITGNRRDRVIVAGDFNLLFGHGEHGDEYWARRYATVFDRAEVMGLRFIGPQAPNGRQADPWPDELPKKSLNVPTFHHSRQTPVTATRQLDFVFASDALANRVEARALNSAEEWGPSDHCRIAIRVSL